MKHRDAHIIQMFDIVYAHATGRMVRPWTTIEECQSQLARRSMQALLKAAQPFVEAIENESEKETDSSAHTVEIRLSDLHALRRALIDAQGFA